MPDTTKTFYLTTPIYYVNARPHIGHAYTTIVADVLARRHRLLGDDTFFLTGTDEHGQKIERSAAAAGIPPQQFADEVSASFEDLWKRMGITHNEFIRTTDPAHVAGVQKLFSELYARGFIELRNYTGSYCVSDETFVDAPAGTPCPDCGRLLETVTEENFFFRLSSFQEPLIDLIESNRILITPETRRNEVLSFLRGSPFQISDEQLGSMSAEDLADFMSSQLEKKLPRQEKSRLGNLYVPGALKDLSISRSSFTWGIPVPEPAANAATQKHVIYVWLDALANYMTAIGYGASTEEAQKQFEHYWPADLHLVGKEIIRFHCVYWPAFLLAADIALPKQITAHGWLLFDNSKMSKSKGNIVRTETILDAFGTLCPPAFTGEGLSEASLTGRSSGLQPTESAPPEKGALAPGFSAPTMAERDLFAADILRYHLLREIPFGQDGSFSFDAMITRYNADLTNGYGNLVKRILTLCNGKVPLPSTQDSVESLYADNELLAMGTDQLRKTVLIGTTPWKLKEDLRDQLLQLWFSFSALNDYLSYNAPWKLGKEAPEQRDRISEILYTAAESIRIITALLYPILPYATARVWAQLGLGDIELAARNGDLKNLAWGGLKPGTKLGPLSPIFPRADKGLAQIMTDLENQDSKLIHSKLETEQTPSSLPTSPLHAVQTPTSDPAAGPRTASLNSLDSPTGPLPVGGSTAHTTRTGPTPSHTEAQASGIFAQTPTSAEITIDDFTKIELRVAQITLAERIPKADKLLRLEVDLGPLGTRQILSGIAEHYTPEDLLHRKIVVITNLAPRKMRGLESHGMLLAASDGDGGKPILATFAENIPNGTRLK